MVRFGFLAVTLAALLCEQAAGQSLNDRIRDYKQRQASGSATEAGRSSQESAKRDAAQLASLSKRFYDVMPAVELDAVGAKSALTWWSQASSIPIVVNWGRMDTSGISADTPITLHLRGVPAVMALELILQQMSPADLPAVRMIYELTPWYVQIMTREEALSKPVLRVYDLGDMLMEIPNFGGRAPSLDLNSSMGTSGGSVGGSSSSRTTSGGGSGGRGATSDEARSPAERAEQIAQIIRDTIEPDIWIENGGQFCSVRYFSGRLVVNAPMFVQRQIGPSMSPGIANRSFGIGGVVSAPSQGRTPSVSPSANSRVQKASPNSPSSVQKQ